MGQPNPWTTLVEIVCLLTFILLYAYIYVHSRVSKRLCYLMLSRRVRTVSDCPWSWSGRVGSLTKSVRPCGGI